MDFIQGYNLFLRPFNEFCEFDIMFTITIELCSLLFTHVRDLYIITLNCKQKKEGMVWDHEECLSTSVKRLSLRC